MGTISLISAGRSRLSKHTANDMTRDELIEQLYALRTAAGQGKSPAFNPYGNTGCYTLVSTVTSLLDQISKYPQDTMLGLKREADDWSKRCTSLHYVVIGLEVALILGIIIGALFCSVNLLLSTVGGIVSIVGTVRLLRFLENSRLQARNFRKELVRWSQALEVDSSLISSRRIRRAA